MKASYIKFRTQLCSFAPSLILILCILQPILDALSFWQTELNFTLSLSFLPRSILLVVAALYGYIVSDCKRIYWGAACLLSAFWLCHILVSQQNGYVDWVADLLNYIRVLTLPIYTLSLISCLRANKASFQALKKGLALCLLIIIFIAVAAVSTGTEPYTYPDKQEGIRGWCIWPNAQSAIISMLVPIFVLFAHEWKHNTKLTAIAVTVGLLCLFFHGTRLSFAAMVAIGLFFTVCAFIFRKSFGSIKLAALLLIITTIFTVCLPISPMYRNQNKVADNVPIREAIFDELLSQGEAQAIQEGLTGLEYEKCRLAPVYKYYLTDFVDVFGLDTTLEVYQYKDDYSIIPGLRDYKLKFCKQLMQQSVPATKFFGIEISRMFVGHGFDVENDFHATWYLYGYVGLAALLLFLVYFLIRTIRALIIQKKSFPFFPAFCFGAAFAMCIAHAYFTCGVLRRSNSLFYMAALLAGIYILTDNQSLQQK